MTSQNSVFVHDEEWAENLFLPLLENCKFEKTKDNTVKILITTKNYPLLVRAGFSRCVLVIKSDVLYGNEMGQCSLIRHIEKRINFIIIYLNKELFSKAQDNMTKLMELGIHEFVHAVAAMISVGKMETEKLIENSIAEFNKWAVSTTTDDLQSLFDVLANSNDVWDMPLLSDYHFRTKNDGFQGNYFLLFLMFLLPKNCFNEIFSSHWEEIHTILEEKNKVKGPKLRDEMEQEIANNAKINKKYVSDIFQIRLRQFMATKNL